MSNSRRNPKRKQDKDRAKKRLPRSSCGDDSDAKQVKPIPGRPDAFKKDIEKDGAQIDSNIDKASWVLPADAGIFTRIAYILKKALLDMANRGDDNKDDDVRDDEKKDSDSDTDKSDSPAKTGDQGISGRTEGGKDIKKLMAEYNQEMAAG